MRIEDVEVINLHFAYPEGEGFLYAGGRVTARVTSLVLIRTDTDHVGIGAAYSHPELVRAIVEGNFKAHLIGANPADIESIWEKLYGISRWYGRKGAALTAIGGIDIALWDLRGKAACTPVWRLLGGRTGRVQAYASGMFWHDDVTELEREAIRHRERGFRRVKMRLGRSWDYDTAAFAAAVRGVGKDGRVHVDGSHRYALDAAIRFGELLSAAGAAWFEEPFPPEDIDRYVALRRRLKVPLAAGENEFGVQGFRELLRVGAIDVVQADACRTGGITEVVRIAAMAADLGLDVAPHTWSDAVAVTANAHAVASFSNGLAVEVDQTGNPFIENLLVEPLRISDGHLQLSDAPGLGIALDPDALRRLELPRAATMPDGNYSDLIFGAEYFSVAPHYGPIPEEAH
jgi:L-alanine-DL-glutamate epimerase-like enolase superfamily enzyme